MRIIEHFLREAATPVKIYVDLDGTLTNFEKRFEDLGNGTLDEVKARGGISLVWAMIGKAGEEYWSKMEWLPDGKDLWEKIKRYKPTVLSSPTNNPTSKTGKMKWIRMNLGADVPAILVPRKEKAKQAGPNHILFDDMENTIQEWQEAGGVGILHKSARQSIELFHRLIVDFKNREQK